MLNRLATATAAIVLWACGLGGEAGAAQAFAPGAAPAPLFGSVGTATDPPIRLPEWERVLAALAAEAPAYAPCARPGGGDRGACRSPEARAWLGLLDRLGDAPRLEQLRAVNAFVNGWPYRADRANYGRRDHWATPFEFLARSGDCEDYAILKYVSLRRLGVPTAELRLAVVQDLERDTPHAVLVAAAGARWYVLDNLSDRLEPQERIRHYRPYYAVNEEHRWTHPLASAGAGAAASGTTTRAD